MTKRAGVLAVAILVLATPNGLAGTTGQLVGSVTDDQDGPLQGVAVSASSPSQIGAEQRVTTGSDGGFRFPSLAPGYYTVVVELVGYAPRQLEKVQVRLDRVTEIQVALARTVFEAEVEVADMTPVVDPLQVSAGQSFTSEYLTKTSTDWSNVISQTAGASQNFRRVLGSTPQDGGYLLDGMDSTNWYQRFPNLAAFNLPFDSIQEVAVHAAGFEAEYGQATGAVVNVTTKSGGNVFSGTVDVRYTGSSFETAGEHYDPSEQESEDASVAATLGGPILKDRLWFFVSYGRTDEKTTPTGAPTTRENEAETFLGKLTWRPGASWSVVGKYTLSLDNTYNQGSSQFTAADATATWLRDPDIATLETTGVLSPRVLWGFRLGSKRWDETGLPSDGDFSTLGHRNLVTRLSTASWGDQWYATSDQYEVATDLSWFVDDVAGSHDLKLGVSVGNPSFTDDYCLNGGGRPCTRDDEGFFFRDVVDDGGESIPYQMQVGRAEGALEFGGQFAAVYLQDAWRLRSNLTAKLGLRWDRVTYDNETGEIADLSKMQPRVGVAWDIGNDGKTMARASWGRFMHPGTAILSTLTNETTHPSEFWLSCSTLVSPDPEECATFAEDNGFGYRGDPENWDAAGWVLAPWNVVAGEPSQTADDLEAGYADEWLIGIEREVFRRTSLELTYVNKTSKNMFDDTCNGNYPDRDPNGACGYYIVANLPEIGWDYQGLLLRFESQALNNLHLLASWAISESKGSINYNTGATGAFDFYPYHFVNRYGYLRDHSRHRVKLNGYWNLPHDFTLAFNGWWQSEFRWTPYDNLVPGLPYGSVFVEPRGSGVGGDQHQFDLELSKGFRIGATRLVLLATVVNLTNSQHETDICGSVNGCGDYGFGDGLTWQQPRKYGLGMRLEF